TSVATSTDWSSGFGTRPSPRREPRPRKGSSLSASLAPTKITTTAMPTTFEVAVRPIRSEEDLTWALAEVDKVFEPSTLEEEARLEVLTTLVEAYESKHYP